MKSNNIKSFGEFNENLNTNISIDDIKKWVDENISYYDPDDCDWNYEVDQAIDDMLYSFKNDFGIEDDKTFNNEKVLIDYIKSEWEQYYK